MKNFTKLMVITLAFCIGCNQQSEKNSTDPNLGTRLKSYGHEQGNGVDSLMFDHQDTWFSGLRVVTYCAEVAPDFGLADEETIANLKKAFETWKQYIATKRINESIYENLIPNLKPSEYDKAKDLQLFTETRSLFACAEPLSISRAGRMQPSPQCLCDRD